LVFPSLHAKTSTPAAGLNNLVGEKSPLHSKPLLTGVSEYNRLITAVTFELPVTYAQFRARDKRGDCSACRRRLLIPRKITNDGGIIARRCKQRFERNYSMLYWMWIPRLDISSRNRSAGMSRSCSTPPRLVMAPEAIICTTIEAGNAVVRIMALISVLGS